MSEQITVAWFSAGVSSAVATKLMAEQVDRTIKLSGFVPTSALLGIKTMSGMQRWTQFVGAQDTARRSAKMRFLAVYTDGVEDFNAGDGRDKNPYESGTSDHRAWDNGWEDMRDVRRCADKNEGMMTCSKQ
jgi:hypothetical protein